jgi:dolichyl-phosphate-mannose-protein mannosyltransferase
VALVGEGTECYGEGLWDRGEAPLNQEDAHRLPARRDPVLILLLAASLAIRLLIAWAPFSYLSSRGPLVDDAFYSFSIARNLASGHGPTADGVHATSGFQPLYTLLLAPLFLLSRGDPILPIHLALTLLALCGTATGWLIYRMVRRLSGRPGALFAAALWGVSPYVLSQGANGLETGLFGLMAAATLDYHLGRVRRSPSVSSLAILGSLLSLTILSRVDGVFLAAAIAFDLVLLPGRLASRGLRVLLPAAAASLLVAPYALALQLHFGSPVPESGSATRFISLCYGTFFISGPDGVAHFPPESVPWSYYASSLMLSVQVLASEPLFFPFSLLLAPLGWTKLPESMPLLFTTLAGGAVLVNLLLPGAPIRAADGEGRGFARIALAASFIWVPAYAFGALGQWWFPRYFFPVFILLIIASGAVLGRLADSVPPLGRMGPALFAAALGFHCVLFAFQVPLVFLRHKPNRNISTFLSMIPILDQNIPPGERAGAFQSGTLGYFSERRVVNLDGVVNGGALRAMRERRMSEYIRSERIGAVIDFPLIIQDLLVRRSPPGAARALGEVRQEGLFTLIRVLDTASDLPEGAGMPPPSPETP